MSLSDEIDLTDLQRDWAWKREAMREILSRIDPRGLTRPARDASERAWLQERGEGSFIESEEWAEAARAYYARKYQRR
ncbi:MAG: hypothetical protein M3373_02520 [Gemmatimonadota bacterium]|nr:hypothetical protein [Gemmatimonadota bacterium]